MKWFLIYVRVRVMLGVCVSPKRRRKKSKLIMTDGAVHVGL